MTDASSRVHVYIDETGDRGSKPEASSYFAITALMVPSEADHQARVIVHGLKWHIRTDRPLHWSEHFRAKHADRRRLATTLMSGISSVKLIAVVVHKPCLRSDAGMVADGAVFYNYAYKLLLERVAHQANDWPGGRRIAIVKADAVKGLDHTETVSYLTHMRDGGRGRYPVPWKQIQWPPRWISPQMCDGLQLADLYASSLGLALRDVDGSEHFERWMHQIRSAGTRAVLRQGFKLITQCSCLNGRSWMAKLMGQGRTPSEAQGATDR